MTRNLIQSNSLPVIFQDCQPSILRTFSKYAPNSTKFSKKRSWVKDEDSPIELTIPLIGGQTEQNFTVYVGFQLSQEELEFNRKKGNNFENLFFNTPHIFTTTI